MTRIGISLCALGWLTAGAGCSYVARPEIRHVRPRVETIDLHGVTMVFDVDVSNPYPVAIRTPEFSYAVDIAETEFFGSRQATAVDLPALKVGTLNLPARVEYLKLWNSYQGLREADEVNYRLRGTVLVRAMDQDFELPLSHEGTFPVLRLPKISSPEVRFDDVSLSGAQVTMEADIRNPNVFRLGLDQLGMDVTVGEVEVGNIRPSLPGGLDPRGTGKLSLVGQITSSRALSQLVRGSGLGAPRVAWTGSLQTPYGPVPIRRD